MTTEAMKAINERRNKIALELLEQLKGRGLTFLDIKNIIGKMEFMMEEEMHERDY